MTFSTSELVLMAHGRNRKLWFYDTTDAAAAVDSAGYFNGAVDMLNVGDLIMVMKVDDVNNIATVTTAGWHIVLSNDGTAVDVSDATVIAVTDTD